MTIFGPSAMPLIYGEPVHQMIARAFLWKALVVGGGVLCQTRYHFVGSHGIVYRGTDKTWARDGRSVAQGVAQLCEEIQQNFNERVAATEKAIELAKSTLAVPPLFTTAQVRRTTTEDAT